jgi:hypothetical protein
MARFPEPIPWRFLLVNLATHGVLACLDPIASSRTVTLLLNAPDQATFQVPSDDIRVNNTYTGDSKPNLSKNVRALYGFRDDGTSPPWTPRFAGPIMQLGDQADTDRSITNVTAFGPSKLWEARPVVINSSGDLPDANGYSFIGTPGNVILSGLIADDAAGYLVRNPSASAAEASCRIDWGVALGGTSHWAGTIETTGNVDVSFARGAMLADAAAAIIATGSLDVLITPIFDPVNRPGYLAEGSIVALAGAERTGAVFAWDLPPNSLVGLSRLDDGTPGSLINVAQGFLGQGGPPVTRQTDSGSIMEFGEMWLQSFWPGQKVGPAVESLMQLAILLAKNGKRVVTLTPAPERGPVPLDAYELGDRVPVYTSSRFRDPIAGDLLRVNGIPFVIGDDGIENVQQLLTSADGP